MYRYLCDIKVGETYESRDDIISKKDVINFARQFDSQPMHINEIETQETFFKTLVASGWHIAALTMRLVVETAPFGKTPLVGIAIKGISFKKKILPETRIFCRGRVTRVTKIPNRDYGYVELAVDTLNKKYDEMLVQQKWTVLVPKHEKYYRKE